MAALAESLVDLLATVTATGVDGIATRLAGADVSARCAVVRALAEAPDA